jgi:hypothetical protein
MPLFRSLRSKSSLKSSSASILSDKDGEFGPRSPSQTTYGSTTNKNDFGSIGRTASKNKKTKNLVNEKSDMTNSPSAASVRSTQSYSHASHNHQQPNSLMNTLSSVPSDLAASNKPRPSELFAGKGVQWDSVKLAGPGAAPALQPKSASSTNEDLQAFLKQRRQWKPTFVTEESTPRVTAPTDLKQLTFMSQDSGLNSKGLMSFEDLDKSHQRKQQLLSDNPLGGSANNLWDEAESSKAGQQRAAAAASNEVPTRRASNFKTSRKNVPAGTEAVTRTETASSVPKAPSRSTSAAHLQQSSSSVTPTTSVDQDASRMPPPPLPASRKMADTDNSSVEVLTPASAAGAVRQSIDTTGNFVTPSSSRPESTQDFMSTNTANAQNATEGVQTADMIKADANGHTSATAVKSDVPATVPEEPATPQAPVASL